MRTKYLKLLIEREEAYRLEIDRLRQIVKEMELEADRAEGKLVRLSD